MKSTRHVTDRGVFTNDKNVRYWSAAITSCAPDSPLLFSPGTVHTVMPVTFQWVFGNRLSAISNPEPYEERCVDHGTISILKLNPNDGKRGETVSSVNSFSRLVNLFLPVIQTVPVTFTRIWPFSNLELCEFNRKGGTTGILITVILQVGFIIATTAMFVPNNYLHRHPRRQYRFVFTLSNSSWRENFPRPSMVSDRLLPGHGRQISFVRTYVP